MAGGISVGGARVASEPNVIPLIDILLVLLIIYMIINAQVRHVLDLQVPPAEAPRHGSPQQIVLELLPNGGFAVNGQPVPDADLDATLRAIYSGRTAKLLFVKAAGSRTYQDVVSAMDRARGAGVEVLGIVPR
ncbi:MAG: biopolymer transporter ExbD [Gemmatimonadota bacterium]